MERCRRCGRLPAPARKARRRRRRPGRKGRQGIAQMRPPVHPRRCARDPGRCPRCAEGDALCAQSPRGGPCGVPLRRPAIARQRRRQTFRTGCSRHAALRCRRAGRRYRMARGVRRRVAGRCDYGRRSVARRLRGRGRNCRLGPYRRRKGATGVGRGARRPPCRCRDESPPCIQRTDQPRSGAAACAG